MKSFCDENTLSRFLSIVELLSGPSFYPVSQIERRTKIPRRSIYRYLNQMEQCGISLRKEGKALRIDPSSPFMKSILRSAEFSQDEAKLLLSSLECIDEDIPIKGNIREKLLRLSREQADDILSSAGRLEGENIARIRKAIDEHWQLRFESYRAQQGVKDYVVEPFWISKDSRQVWCFDTEGNTNKLFLTRRIGEAVLLDTVWQNTRKHRKGFRDVFNMIGDNPFRVKLGLDQKACNLLREEYPLSVPYIKKDERGEWIFDAKVASVLGVGRFVIGMADCVRVYSSKTLMDYIIRFRKDNLDNISLYGAQGDQSKAKARAGRPRKYKKLDMAKKRGRH